MESPDAALTPENEATDADVADKFERLNLFFEKNQQVTQNEYLYKN